MSFDHRSDSSVGKSAVDVGWFEESERTVESVCGSETASTQEFLSHAHLPELDQRKDAGFCSTSSNNLFLIDGAIRWGGKSYKPSFEDKSDCFRDRLPQIWQRPLHRRKCLRMFSPLGVAWGSLDPGEWGLPYLNSVEKLMAQVRILLGSQLFFVI